MDQCLAITKARKRCKRPAAEDCAGYCKPHFDDLPPGSAEAAARRVKAKNLLRKAGRATAIGVATFEVLKDIWEIVGPFLSLRERHYLKILTNTNASSELREKSRNVLLRSLGKANVVSSSRERAGRK